MSFLFCSLDFYNFFNILCLLVLTLFTKITYSKIITWYQIWYMKKNNILKFVLWHGAVLGHFLSLTYLSMVYFNSKDKWLFGLFNSFFFNQMKKAYINKAYLFPKHIIHGIIKNMRLYAFLFTFYMYFRLKLWRIDLIKNVS